MPLRPLSRAAPTLTVAPWSPASPFWSWPSCLGRLRGPAGACAVHRQPPAAWARLRPDWPPQGWAWGLIQLGAAPPQRYGVGAPATVPRAQVLILPGYGDFAEVDFPQASALIAQGDTVWTCSGRRGPGRLGPIGRAA